MRKLFMKRVAAAALIAGTLVAGAVVTAGDASASPQIWTRSGLFKQAKCATAMGISRLAGRAAYCDTGGAPPGYAYLWVDL
jgi:hypothetical protein